MTAMTFHNLQKKDVSHECFSLNFPFIKETEKKQYIYFLQL